LPEDAQANDLFHWQTRLVSGGVEALYDELAKARAVFVSPGVVNLPDNQLGFAQGFLVRGPDGHAVQIVGQQIGGQ
jgi:hypothetical protein